MQEATALLTSQEQMALRYLRTELATIANVTSVIIFGSVARGEAID